MTYNLHRNNREGLLYTHDIMMAEAGGNFGEGRGAVEITVEELERPAKELPLEVLKQLGARLVSQKGNWTSVAEVLGYSREQIDHFETQSVIMKEPAGYLVLKDWTKEENGRSLFVLRESLLQCGRLDCVTYLDRQIKDAMSMNLMIKIVDEDRGTKRFMSVPTLCHATLKDSLHNVLNYGTRTHDYTIAESWTDKARKFKGRHLSVRRKKRFSPESSMSDNECVSLHRAGSPYNDLSSNPVRLPTANFNISMEDDISQEKSNFFEDADAKKSSTIRQYYISDECVHCGKFRTSSQLSRPDSTVQSGIQCTNCYRNDLTDKQMKASCCVKNVDTKPVSDDHVSSSDTAMDCSSPEDDISSHEYYNETFLKRKVLPPKGAESQPNSEPKDLQRHPVIFTSAFQFPVQFGAPLLQTSHQSFHTIPKFQNLAVPCTGALNLHRLSPVDVNCVDVSNRKSGENFVGIQRAMLSNTYTQTSAYMMSEPNKQSNLHSHSVQHDEDDVRFHETFVKAPFDENAESLSNEMTIHRRERSSSEPTESYQQLIRNGNNADGHSTGTLVQPMRTIPSDNGINTHRHTTIADAFSTLQRTAQASVQEFSEDSGNFGTQSECLSTHSMNFDMDNTELKYVSDHSSGSEVDQGHFIQQTSCMTSPQTAFQTRTSRHDISGQEPEVPSRPKHDVPPRLPPPRVADGQTKSNLMKLLKESRFKYINHMLGNYPGWCPKEHEKTVEKTMNKYLRASGYYMIWFMNDSQTLVLTVSHVGKLIHYGIHMKSVNNQIVFYIFDGENFADLTDLLKYYTQHGLKSQQSAKHDVKQPQSQVRLSHVQLRYPVSSTKHCRPSV